MSKMAKPKIIIVGASGHGKVLLDALAAGGAFEVAGFVDAHKPQGSEVLGFEILGREEDLPRLVRDRNIGSCAIGIGDNYLRSQVIGMIRSLQPGLEFPPVIHPSAVVSRFARIGPGAVLCAQSMVGPYCTVGDFALLNSGASLDHDSCLGEFASLAPGVVVGGNVTVGRFSALSMGAVIRHRVEIGEHTVVGAGSLVMASLPSLVVAYGSPAKVVRAREPGTPYL